MKLLFNVAIIIAFLLFLESCKRLLNLKGQTSPKKLLIISTGGTFNSVETQEGLKP